MVTSSLSSRLGLALGIFTLASAACTEDLPDPNSTPQGGPTLGEPTAACTDTPESIDGDPGALAPSAEARGDVVRCATQTSVTKDDLVAKLTALGAPDTSAISGARVFRIAYRTERGDASSTPAVSGAAVYVPDVLRTEKLPVVVAARGSRGQAARCAVSKFDPSLASLNDDALRLVYPLVAKGFAVILPDLAGYANYGAPNNPPSAYAQAADVARSTLDGGRAFKKLFPLLDDKVVLVGHSQGGHSALAALAIADSYGTAGPVVGVAAHAPLWLSQRSWGAILFPGVGTDFPLATSPAGNVSVWYHYTQAELLDGPGEGKKLFAADKQDAVEAFVKNECWGSSELSKVATYAHELFDPAFVNSVSVPATGSSCEDAVCEKWIARYSADRPHLTGSATKTPVLLTYGLKDTTIPPDRMRCGLDRLAEDAANVTSCVDDEQTHGGIVTARGDYVASWIAHVALGETAPAACAKDASAVTVACANPPPND